MDLDSDGAGRVATRTSPIRFGKALYLADQTVLPADVRTPKSRPRSATFVGTLSWSWSPAGSRVDDVYCPLE